MYVPTSQRPTPICLSGHPVTHGAVIKAHHNNNMKNVNHATAHLALLDALCALSFAPLVVLAWVGLADKRCVFVPRSELHPAGHDESQPAMLTCNDMHGTNGSTTNNQHGV